MKDKIFCPSCGHIYDASEFITVYGNETKYICETCHSNIKIEVCDIRYNYYDNGFRPHCTNCGAEIVRNSKDPLNWIRCQKCKVSARLYPHYILSSFGCIRLRYDGDYYVMITTSHKESGIEVNYKLFSDNVYVDDITSEVRSLRKRAKEMWLKTKEM